MAMNITAFFCHLRTKYLGLITWAGLTRLAGLLWCAEMIFSRYYMRRASPVDGWCDEPRETGASLILYSHWLKEPGWPGKRDLIWKNLSPVSRDPGTAILGFRLTRFSWTAKLIFAAFNKRVEIPRQTDITSANRASPAHVIRLLLTKFQVLTVSYRPSVWWNGERGSVTYTVGTEETRLV